ncbi:DUF6602 domain-containing protein [Turicibacter sanguinis]|uniref:DUF6602 domain-containing protein n=1 Tax=Turicibacter sanguinis TaxID=154288 RepID=UPI0006C35D45|nr:DUF6602 domain-containing protein [Turicibacter sanguinis]CUN16235.1 Uncharacterised protein [Turicibacter sanguinis]
MINTVYELLTELKNKGIESIEPYLNIGHNPTIGVMYEGLTRAILEKGIFQGLDLRVATGKIKNAQGELSAQIDCMIVIGDGEKLPFTDAYLYEVEQVIAVIEVKKNLYASDLDSAFHNLKSVYNIAEPEHDINAEMLAHTFKMITKLPLPEHEDINHLEEKHQLLYHALLVESFMPARIVFGYSGYHNEYSLRENFVNYIQKNEDETGRAHGYGAPSLPDLIICGENTLIKANGYPYILPLESDDWMLYASYNQKPLLVFLEIIWTRLTHLLSLSSIGLFGEDIVFEGLNPLLVATGSYEGWRYEYIYLSQEDLHEAPKYVEWQPAYVNVVEFVLISMLCNGATVMVNDENMLAMLAENDANIDEVIDHLTKERLICIENNEIKLLTKQCMTAFTPQGIVAGENKDGRFTNWLNHQLKR